MKNIFFIGMICLLTACGDRTKERSGDPLPAIELLLADSVTRINTSTAEEGHPIALMYFSPDCEHCQAETEGILHHMDSLQDVRFYFVTIDPIENIRFFSGHYKLNKYPNIKVGKDDQYLFLRHFKGAFPPYMVLYDRNKRQLGTYPGGVEPSKILSTINSL